MNAYPPPRADSVSCMQVCQKVNSSVNGGAGVVLYSCASTFSSERARFRCNVLEYGDEPWSEAGLSVQQGPYLTISTCCQTNGCNIPSTPQALAAAAAAKAAATVHGSLAVDLDMTGLASWRSVFERTFKVASPAHTALTPTDTHACRRNSTQLTTTVHANPLPTQGDMATALGVDEARVFVSGVYSGSVIVAFAVEPDADGTPFAEVTLSAAFSAPGVSIAGTLTVAAITSVATGTDARPTTPGFSYRQDPAWQAPGRMLGQACTCTLTWAEIAACPGCVCDPGHSPQMQLPPSDIGSCTAAAADAAVVAAYAPRWAAADRAGLVAYCVECDEATGTAQQFWYRDSSCGAISLSATVELDLNSCAYDAARGVFSSTTCQSTDSSRRCPRPTPAVQVSQYSSASCGGGRLSYDLMVEAGRIGTCEDSSAVAAGQVSY